jgi:hypothetical protein
MSDRCNAMDFDAFNDHLAGQPLRSFHSKNLNLLCLIPPLQYLFKICGHARRIFTLKGMTTAF